MAISQKPGFLKKPGFFLTLSTCAKLITYRTGNSRVLRANFSANIFAYLLTKMTPNYTIIIQWSHEDKCFVVSLPKWGEFCHTHGDTYEEAVKNAKEVLEMLIESSNS